MKELSGNGRKRSNSEISDEIDNTDGKKPRDSKNSEEKQTRSLKACLLCKKKKTRCFRSSPMAVSCLRCLEQKVECSLEADFKRSHPEIRVVEGVPENLLDQVSMSLDSPLALNGAAREQALNIAFGDTKRKLDLIYLGVSELLLMMKGKEENESRGPILESDVKLLLDAASSMKRTSMPSTPSIFLELQGITHGVSLGAKHFLHGTGSTSNPLTEHRLIPPEMGPLDDSEPLAFVSPANTFKTSPYSIITGIVPNIPRPILNLLSLSTAQHSERRGFFQVDFDVISSGILTETEVIDLMNDFRSNYGRWVLFPLHVTTDELIKQIRRKSSFLLTTCCCLSMRYSLNGKPSPGDVDSHRRKKDTYKLVMRQLVKDLDKALLKYASFQGSTNISGDIEFLQAIVILSIYSLSLSSIVTNTIDPDSLLEEDMNLRDLNLDSWYLSGLGLSTFISKANFGTLFQSAGAKQAPSPNLTVLYDELDSNEDQTLTILRIYNHLILIHLVSCVFSGRMCIVDEIRLNYCMSALSLPSATNFDGRMVSEIGILLITYNFVQVNLNAISLKDLSQIESNLHTVKEEMTAWNEQWDYLFSQPALQFVEFCYNFCYILIHFNYIYSKLIVASKMSIARDFVHSDTIDDILKYADKTSLIKIVSHAHTLVKFILTIEDDSYFAYLSDQIHFCFYFGALTLMKSLKFLKTNDKLHYLNDAEATSKGLSESRWKRSLDGIKLLVEKYERVAQDNPDDIITMYESGLTECLHLLFPGVAEEG